MPRDILHLAIPAFPIAVARVVDPALRGRPVAVAPGHSERALLQAVSSEARAEGVAEGMAAWQARRLCPALWLLSPDPALAARAAGAVAELAADYSPVWEPSAPGRLYLDLTGSTRLLGPGRDAAARLEREIQGRLRLSGSVGVAGNKLVARVAAGFLEQPGVLDVLRGSEETFIGPLPVSCLPGVGAAREALLLRDLNLRRVAEVAALGLPQLRLAFGPFAPVLQQRARGVDPTPVQPPRRLPELREETFLEQAENDDPLLLARLAELAERCGFRLRLQGRGARRLALAVHFADGLSETATLRLPVAENLDHRLLAGAFQLFRQACRRRVRVKGLSLRCLQLAGADGQLDLFALPRDEDPRRQALQEALDGLRERHGMDAVRRGITLG